MKWLRAIGGTALTMFGGSASWIAMVAISAGIAVVVWQFRSLAADRDALLGFAQTNCAAARQSFDASTEPTRDARGKPVTARYPRGKLCAVRIAALARFETESFRVTADALAAARADDDRRSDADIDAARRHADQARATALKLETENGRIGSDDRVGGAWFDAINDAGGMRAHN